MRIKKLKKKRIWPSVLGLFFISFLFAVILFAHLGTSMLDIIQRKVVEPVSQAETIAVLFEDYEKGKSTEIQKKITTCVEMIPAIEAVWVSDLKDNKVWSSTNRKPDISNIGELTINQNEPVKLIFENNTDLGIKIVNDDFILDDRFFAKMKETGRVENFLNLDNTKEIAQKVGEYDEEMFHYEFRCFLQK